VRKVEVGLNMVRGEMLNQQKKRETEFKKVREEFARDRKWCDRRK
jgi:hypothetical protein